MPNSGRHTWLFHKGCLSLHSCQTAILPHSGLATKTIPHGAPLPAEHSITFGNIRCHLTHAKLDGSFEGGRWVRGKKAGFFVTEGEWQRKPRFNSQGFYAWLWNGHLFILTHSASIKSVEKAWMWHVVPVSNHLLDTESEFAPWDPRKAHILVSAPAHVSTLNSAYWAFSTFQSAFIWAIALVVLSSFFI